MSLLSLLLLLSDIVRKLCWYIKVFYPVINYYEYASWSSYQTAYGLNYLHILGCFSRYGINKKQKVSKILYSIILLYMLCESAPFIFKKIQEVYSRMTYLYKMYRNARCTVRRSMQRAVKFVTRFFFKKISFLNCICNKIHKTNYIYWQFHQPYEKVLPGKCYRKCPISKMSGHTFCPEFVMTRLYREP